MSNQSAIFLMQIHSAPLGLPSAEPPPPPDWDLRRLLVLQNRKRRKERFAGWYSIGGKSDFHLMIRWLWLGFLSPQNSFPS